MSEDFAETVASDLVFARNHRISCAYASDQASVVNSDNPLPVNIGSTVKNGPLSTPFLRRKLSALVENKIVPGFANPIAD